MNKTILGKIKKITSKSPRTDVLALHEKLNDLEDKAQNSYDETMQELHEVRQQLNENSNNE